MSGRLPEDVPGDLEALIGRWLGEARDAWPDIALEDDDFVRYVGERLHLEADAIARVRAGDLYLACACCRGDNAAIAAFDKRFMPGARATVARMGSQDLVAEVCQLAPHQVVRRRRRRAAGDRQISGSRTTAAWLQVMVTRDAYKILHRRRPRTAELEQLAELAFEVADPELEHLKLTYRRHFREAFEIAFHKLDERARNVLRLEYLDGLNIDKIGELYGVHRATAARWRAKARCELFELTRTVFEQDYKIDGGDFESIMRLIQSELDVSLQRILADG